LYGDGIAPPGFERYALHARSVQFVHPVTRAETVIEAPLPEPFVAAIAALADRPRGQGTGPAPVAATPQG
jgi:hypothetical protein